MTKRDRLFVPLSTEPFLDFKERGKQYEVRACERNFTESFVYSDREIELRKGYSGESIWGHIGEVYTGTLEEIFKQVNYSLVEPQSNSLGDAIQVNKEILGEKSKYIAFQVLIVHSD